MMKNINKIKTLLSPLRLVKKDLSITMIGELFDGFHTIFSVQILAFIVASIQSKDVDDFYFWITVFIILELFAYFFMFLTTRYFSRTFYSMGHMLNAIYLKKFINLDNNKIDMLGTGRSFSIISKGVDSWIEIVLARGINILIGMLAITYAFTVIAFTAGIAYLLVVFSIFLVIFGIVAYGNNLSLKYRKGRKEVTTEYDRNLFKMISSKFEILQNNRIEKENLILGGMLQKILRLSTKEEFITSSWNVAVMMVFAFIQLTVFFWLGLGVIRGTVDFAYFILIFGLINEINRYVWGFSKEIRSIGVQMVNVDMLLDTFDGIAEIRGIRNTTPFAYSKGDISIRNMSFGYTEEKIFDGLSLDIIGNCKTALVGDSGGGKTTLVKIIAGYINPDSGNIIIDGQDIGETDLISYYRNIGYLTQEPSVFDGTIIENLTYALDRDPTEEEIAETIRNSKCDFILEMPDGLQTEIGERGIKLSGGQKQRLAIAKIMLKNPNIILLDEPTSALDSISEQAVSEALHNLFRGRTVVVIAHRLQTVKEADDIIVIKKGRIIERGTHLELSGIKDGEYRRMLDLQTSF